MVCNKVTQGLQVLALMSEEKDSLLLKHRLDLSQT